MPDYLHLSKKGYEIWADSIQEPLMKVLGTETQQFIEDAKKKVE